LVTDHRAAGSLAESTYNMEAVREIPPVRFWREGERTILLSLPLSTEKNGNEGHYSY